MRGRGPRSTCTLSADGHAWSRGTAVLYKEGAEPITAKAGDCFDMPPLTPMSNVNPGPGPSVLLDSFATPPDSPIWRIIEEGQTDLGNEFTKASATPSP